MGSNPLNGSSLNTELSFHINFHFIGNLHGQRTTEATPLPPVIIGWRFDSCQFDGAGQVTSLASISGGCDAVA